MAALSIRDDEGVVHRLSEAPRRIVSLVPSLTESVVVLGGADRLVGVTKWCVRPEVVVRSIPKVRGTKNPDIRKIFELEPDLVLANREENRERHVADLRRRVPVFVTYPRSVPGALKTVRDLGVILQASRQAEDIAGECVRLVEDIRQAAGSRIRTACLIWRDPWMAVGPDTYIHDLLERLGFASVYGDDGGRYPETSLEDLFGREPEVVLLPSEPYEFGEGDRDELLAELGERVPGCRAVLVDGSYLTWWGTRTLLALRYLIDLRGRLAGQ